MHLPTLSVVVPNYNHAKYLPACLEALATQSVAANEIIVIDDGSTDNSVEIIESFARKYSNIKLYRNEVNRGVLYTLNRGLELATSEFICLPGADDQIMPGLFEKSLRLLAEYPQAGLCASICEFHDLGKNLEYYFGAGLADKPCFFSPDQMVDLSKNGKLLLFISTMILSRKAMLEAGKYRADLRWHADWFVCFVVGFRFGVCFVPEPLGLFRIYPESYSAKRREKKEMHREVLRRILELLDDQQYQDIFPRFRDSALLAPFGKEMLWQLLRERRYWKYLTKPYLQRAIWWILRIEGKKIMPRFLAQLYFKVSGFAKN